MEILLQLVKLLSAREDFRPRRLEGVLLRQRVVGQAGGVEDENGQGQQAQANDPYRQ
jgi:hypothetical protein